MEETVITQRVWWFASETSPPSEESERQWDLPVIALPGMEESGLFRD
jgi:hypothetical protein